MEKKDLNNSTDGQGNYITGDFNKESLRQKRDTRKDIKSPNSSSHDVSKASSSKHNFRQISKQR